MSLWQTLGKGYETLNNAAGKANAEWKPAYQEGLGMNESELKKKVFSSSGFRQMGYMKAYKEKYGKNV